MVSILDGSFEIKKAFTQMLLSSQMHGPLHLIGKGIYYDWHTMLCGSYCSIIVSGCIAVVEESFKNDRYSKNLDKKNFN